ncbi:MAG: serine hydrolase domain-containing protein [Lysobacteraceae bacterium]
MKIRIVPVVVIALAALAYGAWSPAISGHRIPAYPQAVVSRPSATHKDAALAGRLDDALRTATTSAGLPSMSAAIVTRDGLAWSGSYGWADIDAKIPATPDSRYRTGSMAKPITAVAMMRLVEQGKLDPDAALGDSIEGLPDASRAITPRQLASHTAGIRHYTAREAIVGTVGIPGPVHYATVQDGLEVFVHDRLRFKPGTDFLYSTYGYSLLSRRLEVATGTPFPALLSQQVFVPCGMNATVLDGTEAMASRVAFYRTENGRFKVARKIDTSNPNAGGGLVSTPEDLARFAMCVLSGNVLSAESRKTMWTPVRLPDGSPNPQNYALGWRRDDSVRLFGAEHPTLILHHGGQQEGGAGFLVIVPSLQLSVAVMTNSGTDEAREASQDTAYALVRAFTGGR